MLYSQQNKDKANGGSTAVIKTIGDQYTSLPLTGMSL